MKLLITLITLVAIKPAFASSVYVDELEPKMSLELNKIVVMSLYCDMDTDYPQHITYLDVIPLKQHNNGDSLIPNSIVVKDLHLTKGATAKVNINHFVTMYFQAEELEEHMYTQGHKNCALYLQKKQKYEPIERLPEFKRVDLQEL